MQVKVQSIHNSLDDSEQFLPEQRLFTQCYFFVHNDMFMILSNCSSTSQHNRTVKKKFIWVLLANVIVNIQMKLSVVSQVWLEYSIEVNSLCF